jgi:hypothetical protein
MVMDRINGFSNLSKGLLDKFQKSDRPEAPDGQPTNGIGSSGQDHRAAPADTVDISPKAHRLIALRHAVDSGRQALDDLPEVRQDRVDQVRDRLNRGYYNSVEVRARVAERLNDVARKLENL